jgi:hypothetical protein
MLSIHMNSEEAERNFAGPLGSVVRRCHDLLKTVPLSPWILAFSFGSLYKEVRHLSLTFSG